MKVRIVRLGKVVRLLDKKINFVQIYFVRLACETFSRILTFEQKIEHKLNMHTYLL